MYNMLDKAGHVASLFCDPFNDFLKCIDSTVCSFSKRTESVESGAPPVKSGQPVMREFVSRLH